MTGFYSNANFFLVSEETDDGRDVDKSDEEDFFLEDFDEDRNGGGGAANRSGHVGSNSAISPVSTKSSCVNRYFVARSSRITGNPFVRFRVPLLVVFFIAAAVAAFAVLAFFFGAGADSFVGIVTAFTIAS